MIKYISTYKKKIEIQGCTEKAVLGLLDTGAVVASIQKLVFLVVPRRPLLLATLVTMEGKRSNVTLTDEHNSQGLVGRM